MKKDFYRFEHSTKKVGPYNFNDSDYNALMTYFGGLSSDTHPEPFEDSLLMENLEELPEFKWEDYKFGFDSYKQFRRWFYHDKLLNRLMNRGFVLNLYRVDSSKMFVGYTQAIVETSYLDGITPKAVEMFD